MIPIHVAVVHPAGIADILGDQVGDILRRIAHGFVDAAGFLLQVTIDDLNGGLRIDLSAGWIQTVLSLDPWSWRCRAGCR